MVQRIVPVNDATHIDVDVIVIGAGLAGTTAASAMSRAGHSVALIDTHAVHPPEFRAEKLGEVQMALFERLGLAEVVRAVVTPLDDVRVYRFGRPYGHSAHREYGFAYSALINGFRAALPSSTHFIVGKVKQISTGPERQSVTLADGTILQSRLVVLATGLGDTLRRAVGVRRIETGKAHSLSLGMTLSQPAAACPFDSLTYFGHDIRTRMAYLTLFKIGNVMRANFFVYRQAGDEWTKAFRRDPRSVLCDLAPGLRAMCGDFALAGPVEIRPIDLVETEDYRREGVVLLGDAFCTTCPVPGVGIQRAMTDVERLCTVHLPRWLQTPGMPRAKIDAFYDDPVKRAADVMAIAASRRARSMATDPAIIWSARRLRNNVVRRLIYTSKRVAPFFAWKSPPSAAPQLAAPQV